MKNIIQHKVCIQKTISALAVILALSVVANNIRAESLSINHTSSPTISFVNQLHVALNEESAEPTKRRKRVRRTGESTDPTTESTPELTVDTTTDSSTAKPEPVTEEQIATPSQATPVTTIVTETAPLGVPTPLAVEQVKPVITPAPPIPAPVPVPVKVDQVSPVTPSAPVNEGPVETIVKEQAVPELTPAMVVPAPEPQPETIVVPAPVPAPKPIPETVPTPIISEPGVSPSTPGPQQQELVAPAPVPQIESAPTATIATPTPTLPSTSVVSPEPEQETVEVEPTIKKQVKRPRRRPPSPSPQAGPDIKKVTPMPAKTTTAAGGKRRSLPKVNFDSLGVHTALDRWSIVDALGYPRDAFDPYNANNPLKADKPIAGSKDWFFDLGVISDAVFESRYIPTPVGVATTNTTNSYDTLGNGGQTFINENLEFEFVLYKGDTIYRPPDFEFRFIPVLNYNRLAVEEVGVVKVDPTEGTTRTESFVGIQGLFADVHLRDVSTRYDFDSIRIGIQPFTADFRGFLFLDRPFGVRLFGTRSNNYFQYNLAWFKRFDKDINSGLNDVAEIRDDDIFVGNLYWQDMPTRGFTSQFVFLHNRNTEGDETRYDENGFIQRPASLFEERGGRDYDVTYLGYNGDGHFGRTNLTASVYFALGQETSTAVNNTESDISAFMTAAEASIDFDWMRFRVSGFYGSGDEDPFDDKATGFDAVLENPQFAGTDSSYYLRQGTPFIGGGGVALSQRNGILNSLRSSKEQGQSNFVNPGIVLIGFGADLDLLPTLRLSANLNQLWFEDTTTLEVLRQQANIDKSIGTDLSMQLIYRPLLSQNIVFQFSYAMLIPGDGYTQLFGDSENPSSIIANLILTY